MFKAKLTEAVEGNYTDEPVIGMRSKIVSIDHPGSSTDHDGTYLQLV